MKEMNRLLRHLIAPLVVIAVDRGWLPEAAQGDVTEALVLLVGLAVPVVWSWMREKVA